MESADPFEALLNPRSVAIIGASSDAARIGGRPIARLLQAGYEGRIYPVNPARPEIQGLKAYPGIGAIDGAVDCALIALPAEGALQAVRECGEKGVKAVVLFSGGFAEVGGRGVEMQAELTALGRQYGMRILGPNCLGLYNVSAKFYLTFTAAYQPTWTPGRNVALISQSGGYGGQFVLIAQRRGIEVGHWLTTGNEADLEFGELLGALAVRPEVNVIVGYVEGIRSRETFIRGLEAAHRNRKPVIIMKVGRSALGAEAAASHTASLAGADDVYNAVFREYGVHRAGSTEEAMDVAYGALRGNFPSRGRLCVVTPTGGVGVQIADFASDFGVEMPVVPEATQREILKLVPTGAARNPVDITGQLANDPSLLANASRLALATGAYDALFAVLAANTQREELAKRLLETMSEVRAERPDILIGLSVLAKPEVEAAFEKAGFLLIEEPQRMVRMFGALAAMGRAFDRPLPDRLGAPRDAGLPVVAAGTRFNEAQAKVLVARCGVPAPPEKVVQTAKEASDAAVAMGFPVALKVVSADILHKTEVGGVALGLASAAAVAGAFATMAATVSERASGARIEGYLVSKMIAGGVECILGVHRDPLFGPVVMFGLGGVMVELFKDVTVRLAPVSVEQAMDMVREIKGFPLLNGYRGKPKADLAALAEAISSASRLAAANPDSVKTIEINPLVAMPEGGGVYALDAVVETIG
jgi:acyl-CoA synthetase (NDP forming)